MKDCPGNCGNAIDFEEDYTRWVGGTPHRTELWEPPWFDNEDEYHSAFASWLNDSDEEYKLSKTKGILWVIPLKKN